MRTRDIMHTEVLTTFPGESLTDVATRMRDHEVGSLVVMADSGEILGVVTERDLVRAMADGRAPRVTTVATWMSGDPVIVAPDVDVRRAAELMVRHGIRHLPVVERGVPVGVISARDVLLSEAESAALLDPLD